MTELAGLFGDIEPEAGAETAGPLYTVVRVPGRPRFFVGKDGRCRACLLIAMPEVSPRMSQSPIRLRSVDAQFDLHCRVREGESREGRFTIIRCRENDRDLTRYFLALCESVLRVLGDEPSQEEIAGVVSRLAGILRRVALPSVRSLNGLFGELFLLLRSSDALGSLSSWRASDTARFDFSCGDVRLDVKATSNRERAHTFSYEQCNPPVGTIAIVASLHAELAGGGMSLYALVREIEARVSSDPDLVFKLHENVAATLGATLDDALQRRYDVQLAESSLRFFRLEEVPAIRGELPVGVSSVHFRSDLSPLSPVAREALIAEEPTVAALLPCA